MKKKFLSMAVLSLFALGVVHAQDQDKNRKDEQKKEQPVELRTDDQNQNPDQTQQKLSDEEQQPQDDTNTQFDPNQQPVQEQQPEDTSAPR